MTTKVPRTLNRLDMTTVIDYFERFPEPITKEGFAKRVKGVCFYEIDRAFRNMIRRRILQSERKAAGETLYSLAEDYSKRVVPRKMDILAETILDQLQLLGGRVESQELYQAVNAVFPIKQNYYFLGLSAMQNSGEISIEKRLGKKERMIILLDAPPEYKVVLK